MSETPPRGSGDDAETCVDDEPEVVLHDDEPGLAKPSETDGD